MIKIDQSKIIVPKNKSIEKSFIFITQTSKRLNVFSEFYINYNIQEERDEIIESLKFIQQIRAQIKFDFHKIPTEEDIPLIQEIFKWKVMKIM